MKIGLVASGDLRESANTTCWPAQLAMEKRLTEVLAKKGHTLERQHPVKADGHGFIASQREGMNVFANINQHMPLIVAEAVWQYSHHVLPGLTSHKGPILTLANWSGEWPGLVGMLNLNGSLTKAGVRYATLWSENFDDPFFCDKLNEWLETGEIRHDCSSVGTLPLATLTDNEKDLVQNIALDLRRNKAILGVFDEGCMGMYNAIVPDELLIPLGIFKERLSQSALYHAVLEISDKEASAVFTWYNERGLTFHFGSNPSTELTREQVLLQCKMYVAAVRLADTYGCEAIGIQYQQGLKDLLPASDLVEGTLNNSDRPEVRREDGSVIRKGEPVFHFNEVDECSGLDAVLLSRVNRAIGEPLETTLHDIRWGDKDRSGSREDFIWVLEISGGAPPNHHEGGWMGSECFRQPPMYFPAGGGTLKGIAKPGPIVWSRIFVSGGQLHMDIGRGEAVSLPSEETERRSRATTYEWPMMHAVLEGVSRNQLMARHKSNHIQVVYATCEAMAEKSLAMRMQLATELGINAVRIGT